MVNARAKMNANFDYQKRQNRFDSPSERYENVDIKNLRHSQPANHLRHTMYASEINSSERLDSIASTLVDGNKNEDGTVLF